MFQSPPTRRSSMASWLPYQVDLRLFSETFMIEPSIEGCRKARPCSLGVPSSAAYASAKKRHQANMITKMRCSKAYCISLSKSCRGVHCGTPISTRLTANPIWQPLATTLILPYPYLRFQIEFVSIICFFHAGSLH